MTLAPFASRDEAGRRLSSAAPVRIAGLCTRLPEAPHADSEQAKPGKVTRLTFHIPTTQAARSVRKTRACGLGREG